jgi:CyaY protein
MEFEKLADDTIQDMIERLETEGIDLDFEGNMLQIQTDNGVYVINKHSTSRQIWMASPISGAKHFIYNPDKQQWIDSGGLELFSILSKELKLS